jgi:hypothetical protein
MKRIFLLAILLGPGLLKCQDKQLSVYPSLGMDIGGTIPFPLSDIPDGAKGNPKISLSLGIGSEYRFSPKWSIGIEFSYHTLAFSAQADVRSQPFYFDNHQDILYFSGRTRTDVEFRMLELPLTVAYKLNARWSILAGAYYSRILRGTFNSRGSDGVLSDDKSITDAAQLPGVANTSYNFNDFLDPWDTGMMIGCRHDLVNRLAFWANVNIGFNSIFKREFENIEYELYQVRLNMGLSFRLFS